MIKFKYKLGIIIAIILIVGSAILYVQSLEKTTNFRMPESLGDMNLTSYKEGNSAIKEINELHNYNLRRIEKAYIAEYSNISGRSKAKLWLSEAENNDNAISLATLMENMVGKVGMYSEPKSMNIDGITVFSVSATGGMEHMGLHHYFFAKGNKVYWIQIDNDEEAYRINIIKESIKKIN